MICVDGGFVYFAGALLADLGILIDPSTQAPREQATGVSICWPHALPFSGALPKSCFLSGLAKNVNFVFAAKMVFPKNMQGPVRKRELVKGN